jgi:hypothetical protein
MRESTMKTVVLEPAFRAKLGGGAAKVTLVDEAGQPVGHYLPDDLYRLILDALLPPEADPRAAGIKDMQNGNVVTTAELLSGLRERMDRWVGEP